jgi:hypothetical protein
VAGRIVSNKNSSEIIGNRARDLPVCSAVSQPLHHRVYRTNAFRHVWFSRKIVARKFVIFLQA